MREYVDEMTDDARTLLAQAVELSQRLGPGDLDETLDQITAAAVQLIPDGDFASITIRDRDDRLMTVSATDERLGPLDEKQYELREGPCYDAATDTGHVVSPDLENDSRFPRFGPVAAAAGIGSQAAFRLFERDGAQGALNVYSTKPGAFTEIADLAGLFQSQATVALAYAHEVTNLREAVETRTTIGQAMGILMERFTLTDERAFAFLTRLSQTRNIKLRLIAEELVTEAAGNAEVAEQS